MSATTSPADPPKQKRRKAPLLEWIEYGAYRVVAALAASASDAAVSRWGTRLGRLTRTLLGKRDRLALANLRRAFPEKSEAECRTILDSCWEHFGRETLGYIRLQRMSLEEIAAACPFVGGEILQDALAEGKGVVLISAHYGGWEVGGLALMALVENVRTVARPLDNRYLERDLSRLREKTGAEIIDRRHAARPLYRALSEGAMIVLLPDQAVLPREGVLIPFLGRPAWTTDAPAKLALRLGSRIVFAFCIPDGPRHRLEFSEPFRVAGLPKEEQDPVQLTAKIHEVIGRRIAERPDLWLWMHDRWKGTGEATSDHAV